MSHDASLEPILRAVEPALRLVSERHLRQILSYLIDCGQPLPTNPELPYWFTREELVDAAVLPSETLEGNEPRLLLVTDPDDRMIADHPRPQQLHTHWRVLFQAAVMKAIDQKLTSGELSAEKCTERLNQFGAAAVREIRFVLENEHCADPNASDVDRYRVFAALYLDLDYFKPQAAEEFFPALPNGHAVRDALAEDVPIEQLLGSSRPAGAPDPEREPPPDKRWSATPLSSVGSSASPSALAPSTGELGKLLQEATDAEEKGNFVRAALLRTQAAQSAEPTQGALASALSALGQLVDRLGDVLDWDHETRQEWRQALGPLLPLAAAGDWPRAARCLYELQRIPAELAREVYAVDLPEYIRTLGRRPVRRHLPHARPVMVLMALRKAHRQLLRAGLGEQEQLRLDWLMQHEIHRRDHAIRHDFSPLIVNALSAAGLVPANRVEEVARDKMVEELLDRICESGYLRIGNLRDAIARNQLKMPDLRGVGEVLTGDALLRTDTNLADALDGVYRRGEFYLRWIQRFSSIFFGTSLGRLFALYIALPFGGAFLVLMFAEHLQHLGEDVAARVARSFDPKPATGTAQPVEAVEPGGEPVAPEVVWEFDEEKLEFVWNEAPTPAVFDPETQEFVWLDPESAGRLAQVAFTSSELQITPTKDEHASVLVTWPSVLGFGLFLLLLFHVPPFRGAVFTVLKYLWRVLRGVFWDIPLAVWRSRIVRRLRQCRPARFFYRHFATPLLLSLLVVGTLFLFGVSPRFLLWWGWLLFAVLAAAYNTPHGWVIQDRIAEALSDWWRIVRVNLIPGLIATFIDWFKMLANWFERQLYAVDEWMRFRGGDSGSSIVVKALLGLIWFPIAYIFRFVFYLLFEPQVNPVKHFPVVTVGHKVVWPMLPSLANLIGWGPATFIINGCPGIFGFVAWELKENWRLYAANRPSKLKPVMVGSHGESMRGLLRPGFHSGTVPKLHRKLRHAMVAGDRLKAARLHHDLEHVVEGVHRFIERELTPLLAGDSAWGVEVEVGAVRFGCLRAEIDLNAPALGRESLVIAFENVGGVIESSIANAGWSDKLTDAQRATLAFALRGVLDMGAAERFDGRERTTNGPDEPGFATLARRVSWDEWVERWGAVREGVKG